MTLKNFFILYVPIFLYFTSTSHSEELTLCSKTFEESFILSNILSQALQEKGFDTIEERRIATERIRKRLLDGTCSIYWEYTGTAYISFFKKNNKNIYTNPEQLYEAVKKEDLQKNNVVWLKRSNIHNGYGMVVRTKTASEYNLTSLADLKDYVTPRKENDAKKKSLRWGVVQSFEFRPDGLKAIERTYDYFVSRHLVSQKDHGPIYKMLSRGQVDIGMGYTTDPQLADKEFYLLTDPKHAFPYYHATPVALKSTLERFPIIATVANKISSKLDQGQMISLNKSVILDKRPIHDVAKEWLILNGLIQ